MIKIFCTVAFEVRCGSLPSSRFQGTCITFWGGAYSSPLKTTVWEATAAGPQRQEKRLAQRGQKILFVVRCDWISIHFGWFLYFCGQSVVAVIMIDGSKTLKSL